jgi:mannosyltransferase
LHKRNYIILAVVSFILRVIGISNEPLWYDEAFTWFIAHLSTPEQVIRATLGDVHPPLWYLIEWVVIHTIGSEEWKLRLPSVFFGTIAVLLLYRLCIVFGLERRVAFCSGLIAAVLAAPLYYSQEARVYSLMACAVLWMIQAGWQENWYQFAVAMVLTVYSQNLGLLYAVVIGLWMIFIYRSWVPLFYSVFAGVLWLPWIPGLIQQMHNIQSGFWTTPIDLGWWLNWIPTTTLFDRVDGYFMALLYPVVFALTIAGLYISRNWFRSIEGSTLLVAAFVPPLLAGIASVLWHPVFISRAFLASGFMLIILWVFLLFDKTKRNAVLIALVPVLIVGLYSNYLPMRGGRGDAKNLLAPIRNDWQLGDVIYYPGVPESVMGSYYLSGLDYRLNPASGDLNQMLPYQTKIDMGLQLASFDLLPSMGFKRVWVVANVTAGTSSDTLALMAKMQGHATLITNRDQVEIWLLNL